MKTGGVIAISAGAVGLAAFAVWMLEQTSKNPDSTFLKHFLTGGSGSSANPVADHAKMQQAINAVISGNLDHWNAIKTGGAHGVPANSKTVKPLIYAAARQAYGIGLDDGWQQYSYPGLIVNENAGDGLGRDTKPFSLGDITSFFGDNIQSAAAILPFII